MASSYALPASGFPQHQHHHSSEHLHLHSHTHTHTHSHPPPSFSSLNPSKPLRGSNARPNGEHSHNHSHSHTHDDYNNSSVQANAHRLMEGRPNLAPPLTSARAWQADSTVGVNEFATPTKATFDAAGLHRPPTPPAPPPDISAERSQFTSMLLPYTSRWPFLHAIMTDKNSRRIFYFMTLNLAFMAVQAFYGYVTNSLGLLSDSVHMFFDCVGLAVGLFAAVASKWPPSERFPYGFGKIETLSGFTNGVFLILISVEFMIEAFERIIEGKKTQRLEELFVVSTLGLLVNLVGIFAFGHHHHGHDHDHGGHSHSSSHSHSHCHGHTHLDNEVENGSHNDHTHTHAHSHSHSHSHHGHSHDNENMHGIYLHVLADTLGSAAVIVSTALTYFWGWSGWDPLASFFIAVLIIMSAIPLVKSSAHRLLLTIPDDIEYNLRETLSGITGLRGVAGYSVPKFWLDDRNTATAETSGHDHNLNGNSSRQRLLGVMHVVAVRGADVEDVRDRVRNYLFERNIDSVLQVEREGDTTCWCGVGRSPLSGSTSVARHRPVQSSSIF